MFRGKPAITRYDWPFTPFHSSSENYATFTRSIHYNLAMERSPRFGYNRSNLTRYCFNYKDLYTVAFAKAFNLATPINLLTHYAKGTSSFRKCRETLKFRLLLELLIQTISLVYNKFFTISFTVLFTIAKFIILSLRGWFPFVPTSFLSSYFIVDLIDLTNRLNWHNRLINFYLQDCYLLWLSVYFFFKNNALKDNWSRYCPISMGLRLSLCL